MATGSELDFRDNTPAADSGYQLGKFQKGPTSGTDPVYQLPIYPLSVEMPANGGVSKLTAGATAAVGDCGKLLSFTLSGAATYALPATPPSVPDGGGTNRWKVSAQNETGSTASLTLSATSPAKLDGTTAGTLALTPGSGVQIYTDGTDYFTERGVTSPVGLATQTGVQQQSYTYAADSGAANAYAVSLTPTPTVGAGGVVVFKAANANTGASTLAVNGGSATAIKKEGTVALIAGDIVAGQIVCVVNDGTNWQMFGVPALPVGSATQQGILQVDGTSITASGGVASATGAPVIKGVYTSNSAHAARTSTGSLSAAFTSNVKAGNAILVITYNGGGTAPVPSDGVNTYTAITPGEAAAFATVQVFLAVNVAGGATTISATTSGLGAFYAWELQNVVGASAFDNYGFTPTGSGAPLAITATTTTTNASDYLLGIDFAQITTVSGTWNSPFTAHTAAGPDVNGANIFMGDANVTSAGSQSVTFNASTTTGAHNLFLIALKVATGVTDVNGKVGHIFAVSSLTTTGSSGAASYNAATGNLNVPNYSLASGVYVPSLLTPPPAIGSWTWVNQGSATDDNNNGFIYINAPASSSFSLRMLSLPLTSTTFTFRATLRAMFPQLVSSQSYAIGIGLRESSSGKVILMYYASFGTGGTLRIGVNKYTSPTVFSSNLKDVAAPQFVGNISFQIQQDGTNRLFAWGDDDGGHFPIALVQEAQSTFMTPDQVVLVADSENSASNAAVLLNGMTLTYP